MNLLAETDIPRHGIHLAKHLQHIELVGFWLKRTLFVYIIQKQVAGILLKNTAEYKLTAQPKREVVSKWS